MSCGKHRNNINHSCVRPRARTHKEMWTLLTGLLLLVFCLAHILTYTIGFYCGGQKGGRAAISILWQRWECVSSRWNRVMGHLRKSGWVDVVTVDNVKWYDRAGTVTRERLDAHVWWSSKRERGRTNMATQWLDNEHVCVVTYRMAGAVSLDDNCPAFCAIYVRNMTDAVFPPYEVETYWKTPSGLTANKRVERVDLQLKSGVRVQQPEHVLFLLRACRGPKKLVPKKPDALTSIPPVPISSHQVDPFASIVEPHTWTTFALLFCFPKEFRLAEANATSVVASGVAITVGLSPPLSPHAPSSATVDIPRVLTNQMLGGDTLTVERTADAASHLVLNGTQMWAY